MQPLARRLPLPVLSSQSTLHSRHENRSPGPVVIIVTTMRACGLDRQGTGWGQNRHDRSSPQNRHNRLPLRLRWIGGDGLCRVTFRLPVAARRNHSLSGGTFSLLGLVAPVWFRRREGAVPLVLARQSHRCRSHGIEQVNLLDPSVVAASRLIPFCPCRRSDLPDCCCKQVPARSMTLAPPIPGLLASARIPS